MPLGVLAFRKIVAGAVQAFAGAPMDPRKMQMLFAVIILPATMLGRVYYPWSALHQIGSAAEFPPPGKLLLLLADD